MCLARHSDFESRATPAGLEIAHDPRGFVSPADFAHDNAVELLGLLRGEGG